MIGSKVVEFQSLESTSNYIAKAIREGEYDSGSVILAHFQTDGRGQRSNKWQSSPHKNLTFSFAIEAEVQQLGMQFLYSKAISVALIHFLEEFNISFVSSKWPNDILIGSRKVAGILIESIPVGSVRFLIVGIGLNVNQTKFSEGVEATSMCSELGRSIPLDSAFKALLQTLNQSLGSLLNDGGAAIHDAYMSRLYGAKSWIKLKAENRIITARIRNVDNDGVLLVNSKQGFPSSFRLGEVKIEY